MGVCILGCKVGKLVSFGMKQDKLTPDVSSGMGSKEEKNGKISWVKRMEKIIIIWRH